MVFSSLIFGILAAFFALFLGALGLIIFGQNVTTLSDTASSFWIILLFATLEEIAKLVLLYKLFQKDKQGRKRLHELFRTFLAATLFTFGFVLSEIFLRNWTQQLAINTLFSEGITLLLVHGVSIFILNTGIYLSTYSKKISFAIITLFFLLALLTHTLYNLTASLL